METLLAVVAVLGLGLAAACVLVAWGAMGLLKWYAADLTKALELVIRHQDDAIAYQHKALGDAIASGRQTGLLGLPGATHQPDPLGESIDDMARRLKGDSDIVG